MAIVRRELFSDSYDTDGALGPPNYGQYATAPYPIAVAGDCGSTEVDSLAVCTAVPQGDDRWAEIKLTSALLYDPSSYFVALWLFLDDPVTQGYRLALTSAGWAVWDHSALTDVHVDTDTIPAVGQVWRIERQGDTLRVLLDDVEQWSSTGFSTTGGNVVIQSYKNTVQVRDAGRWDDFRVGDWTEQNISIDLVNTDNTILSGEGNTITGSNLTSMTDLTVNDVSIPFVVDSDVKASFDPVSAFSEGFTYGPGTTVAVTDGTNSDSISVELLPPVGYTYVEGSGVDTNTGLAQVGGTNGDQWVFPFIVGPSSLVVQSDTNWVLDAPVPDGTTWNYDLYTGGAWDTGTVTINAPEPPVPDTPAFWIRAIPSISIQVGVPTSGTVFQHAAGTEPLGFAEILGQGGGNLVTRSDGTYDGYVSTANPFDMQWRVSNNANPDGSLSNTISNTPVMPTISEAKHQQVSAAGAQITCTTPSVVGTIYWVADPLADQPSGDQVAEGRNASGNPAELSGSFPITAAGQQPWLTINNGRSGVRYYYWMVQVN